MVAFLVPRKQPHGHPDVRSNPGRSAIRLSEVQFTWHPKSEKVLDIHHMTVQRGQHLFIAGPSGSGKSTLLSLLAGVSVPQSGQIDMLGQRLDKMGGSARDRFRADHLGVIFQLFNLVPYLSVVENVTLPCRFSRRRAGRTTDGGGPQSEAVRLLSRLGISDSLLPIIRP